MDAKISHEKQNIHIVSKYLYTRCKGNSVPIAEHWGAYIDTKYLLISFPGKDAHHFCNIFTKKV